MGYLGMMLAYGARHPTAVPSARPAFGPVPDTIDTGVSVLYREDIGRYKQVPRF
jgi:hypothetical protein